MTWKMVTEATAWLQLPVLNTLPHTTLDVSVIGGSNADTDSLCLVYLLHNSITGWYYILILDGVLFGFFCVIYLCVDIVHTKRYAFKNPAFDFVSNWMSIMCPMIQQWQNPVHSTGCISIVVFFFTWLRYNLTWRWRSLLHLSLFFDAPVTTPHSGVTKYWTQVLIRHSRKVGTLTRKISRRCKLAAY